MHVPRHKKVLFAALAMAGALAAASAVLEVALRLSATDQRGALRVLHPVLHHALLPNASLETRWGDVVVPYRTNSLGMRDERVRDVPLRKPPGATRILFLGDSFTEGIGVPYPETFVARLGAITGAETLNGGVSSYCPLLEYLRLSELYGRGFSCDRVVVLLDLSDVQDELVYHAASGSPLGFHNPAAAWVYNHSALVRFLYLRTSALLGRDEDHRRSAAVSSASRAPGSNAMPRDDALLDRWRRGGVDQALWTDDPRLYERWGKRGIELVKKDLLLLRDLASRHGTPMTLVIYPWPPQLESTRSPCLAQTVFGEFAAANGIELIDLFEEFRRAPAWRSLFIAHDVHWNARGHELVARALARSLDR